MDSLVIFAARYLVFASPLITLAALWYVPAKRRVRYSLAIVAALVLTYLLGKLGSHFFYDPRPFVLQGVAPLIPHAADNGFPSDHTLLAAGLAAVVGAFDKKASALLWAIALVVGAARVVALVHHPVDIVGSALAAVAAALIVSLAMHWLRTRRITSPSYRIKSRD